MEISPEIEEYIKESINDALGLPISSQSLQLKLRATEDSHRRLRDQYLLLVEQLHRKDQLIDKAKSEASMNALAVKKFVEENQRLAEECRSLVNQCNKLEREISLYEKDRDALMDFGNEADDRAKEAEIKVDELDKMLRKMYDELTFYKQACEASGDNSAAKSTDMERNLLESILSTTVSNNEVEISDAYLEACGENESFQKLLGVWNSLNPSTRRVLTLVAKVDTLQKDKDHLRVNLSRAEEEVNMLFEENKVLEAENKKLSKQHHCERSHDSSGGKHTSSASAKGNKRKSRPRMSSPIEFELKSDVKDTDLVRHPLSPLRQNSPEYRMHKK